MRKETGTQGDELSKTKYGMAVLVQVAPGAGVLALG
jgi:hypothetical protein